MQITIDPNSGFCFGVVYAIQMAEDELDNSGQLYCLGDIVHNNMEVERLRSKGLEIIDHERLKTLRDCKVLIRAHGEPPETYKIALENNIELIDASCPVVLKLQNRVRTSFDEVLKNEGQVVIYGEIGHAEVNGLVGQTHGKAIIVRNEEDLDQIDFSKPVYFFSQTTKSTKGFENMKKLLEDRAEKAAEDEVRDEYLTANDTVCRQVSNREPQLRKFAAIHDVIVFVSGKKSSNGKVLYEVCRSVNPRSYFVSDVPEIDPAWFENAASVGICGATSTPMWLMKKTQDHIAAFDKSLA
ncbi:MAG: 4-hydroxy-3-methylbut-2-enyl diphosphate reductase [Bacteroidetes bacterium]|nr:MAG: 4-hydroxy-3-methylbut-2-enyl diphosphate reductase [Bacteroidota bacterium]REK06942.1 MAG: 4-hydroxy-3-methylbut-2-enyl diphosphate reductase [Bacteroidota bacterium]REK33710.1 MAG: 4-hydroxy-3-methylbut-2-enyl diphosphate reductase [Bacteroidota bacterium]REK47213.1 MAG: 4-hydroxy-3-methylbut-2-enyl diphosphate reductase [Bacteroidota bacterium]